MTACIVLCGVLTILPRVHGHPFAKPDVSPHLTLMGFTLEKNTLSDVQNKLGISTAGACSEDVEASKMTCYVSAGPDRTEILFESGFAGGWSRLDGFKVVSGNFSSKCHLQCKVTDAVGKGVQTSGGLKLGMTEKELVALLGRPIRFRGNQIKFEWWSKRPMTKVEIAQETKTFKDPVTRPYWDVHDTIEVVMRESEVAEFEIQHTVTY